MLRKPATFPSRIQFQNTRVVKVVWCKTSMKTYLLDIFSLMKTLTALFIWFGLCAVHAELSVTVGAPKIVGQKADVPMEFKNSLDKKVDSVRAVTFLLDENGKVVAQATRWIIGGGQVGKSNSDLPANATRTVHFVVPSDKPFATTNLAAKVSFTRVVLEGGHLLDPKEVQVKTVQK